MEPAPFRRLYVEQQDRAIPALNLSKLSDFSDRDRNLPDRRSGLQRLDIPRDRTTPRLITLTPHTATHFPLSRPTVSTCGSGLPPTACTKNNATARAAEGATRDPGRAPVPKSSRPDASTDEQLSEMTGRYVNGPPVIGAEASFAQRGTEPDGSHLRLLFEETHGGDHPASRFNTRATCIACQ